MTHHNGYSEEWRGTGGPTISANRIRAIEANRDLLRSELLLATAKPRHPVRNACITALIFGAVGFWAGRASAQDTAQWMGTGCQLVAVTAQDHIAEVRCVNVETIGNALTEGVMAVPGLFVGLTVLHGPGDVPGRFTITPEPGFISVPPVLVINEDARATAVILEWSGM